MCWMWQCWRSVVVLWQPWRCTDSWSVGWAQSAFDKQSLQWALDACHGLRICVSMPEPGETWEERILDDGAYCDASKVRLPRLWRKQVCPKVVWAYSRLIPWSWTSSKHSGVVVNKEGIQLKLLTLIDICCLLVLLVARSVATYAVFDSACQVTIVEDLSVQLMKCYKGQLPYCLKLRPVLYRCLVSFSGRGKQHYNKNKCWVSN